MLELFGTWALAALLVVGAVVLGVLGIAAVVRRKRRVAAVLFALTGAGALAAVLTLTVWDGMFDVLTPRPDGPAVAPATPAGAETWSAVAWTAASAELPPVANQEQWDRVTAMASAEGSVVAVGSNSDVMHYVGRIWRSDDGNDWSLVQAPMLDGLELVDVASDGAGYVAIGTQSDNPNAPVAVFLRSPDGRTWEESTTVPGAWAMKVSAGSRGYAALLEIDDSRALMFSADGRTWSRVDADAVEPGVAIGDIAAEGDGWILVGAKGDAAYIARSNDGRAWRAESLPGSGPTDGVETVWAYQAVAGAWSTLVLGLDSPTCDDDPDWCPHYQAAWVWTNATGWQRLPRETAVLRQGHGVRVDAIGPAGFATNTADGLLTSTTGWTWAPVPGGDTREALIDELLLHGDQLLGAGSSDETFTAWFGTASISK